MDLDDEITQSGGGNQKSEETEEGILKRRLDQDRDFDEDEYVERRRKMLDDAYEEARGREDHREPLLPGEPPSIEQNEATMAMISAAQPISVIKSGSWFASPIAATESGFGGSYAGSYSQNSDFSRGQREIRLRSQPGGGRGAANQRFNEMPRYWMSNKSRTATRTAEAAANKLSAAGESSSSSTYSSSTSTLSSSLQRQQRTISTQDPHSLSHLSGSSQRREEGLPSQLPPQTPAASIDDFSSPSKFLPPSLASSVDDYSPLYSLNEEGMKGIGIERVYQRVPPTYEETKVLKGYLYGQLANACIFGIWWTLFSPLVISLFSSSGVGTTRICYNSALFLISPIAGALSEKSSLKQLLTLTALERAIIYTVFLPGAWFLFVWYLEFDQVFYGLFLVAMVCDGLFVALANVLAIDSGGLDLLAGQQLIPIDDGIRNKFNSMFQIFFDGSMIILSPLIAWMSRFLFQKYFNSATTVDYQSITMLGALGGVLGILSLISIFFYVWRIPSDPKKDLSDPDDKNSFRKLMTLFYNVYDGFKIFIRNPRLRWRLVFLAVETSFEDAMVVLMIAEYAVKVIANEDPIEGNFWANVIVATGKVGAVIAGLLMNKFWTPPETSDIRTSRGFRRLFLCTVIAGLMALGVPAAYYFHTLGNTEVATGLIFVSSFLFFFFATIPKIGFATLLQSISAEEDASGRIFGFAATFVTATDAALLMVLSLLFEDIELGKTFWICGGLFVAVSAFEGFFGPYLMNLGGWFSCGGGARGTPSGYESDIRNEFPDASKAEKQSLLVN